MRKKPSRARHAQTVILRHDTRRSIRNAFVFCGNSMILLLFINGHVAELVYAYVSEAYPVRVGSSSLPVTTCYNVDMKLSITREVCAIGGLISLAMSIVLFLLLTLGGGCYDCSTRFIYFRSEFVVSILYLSVSIFLLIYPKGKIFKWATVFYLISLIPLLFLFISFTYFNY